MGALFQPGGIGRPNGGDQEGVYRGRSNLTRLVTPKGVGGLVSLLPLLVSYIYIYIYYHCYYYYYDCDYNYYYYYCYW